MTQDKSLKTTVLGAIADACNLSAAEITVDMNIQDLGLDSWAITAIVAQLEAAYGIEVSTDQLIDLMQAEFVRDFVALVERMTGVASHA